VGGPAPAGRPGGERASAHRPGAYRKEGRPGSSTRPLPPRPEAEGGGRLRNLKITLEYDGSRYRGWQIQTRERTVAGVLTDVFGQLLRERVNLIGAGRTDAGVHAEAQVANFRSRTPMPAASLLEAVNRELPYDINLLRVEDVTLDFHARHNALWRRYRYQIGLRRSAFLKPYTWWLKDPPDQAMMRVAASYLVGRHNFAAFAASGRPVDEPLVEVYEAALEEQFPLLNFRIAADHFLPKMVRKIVGILVRVGRHDFPPERIKKFLDGSEPAPEESVAPPSGLFLEKVEYS
jgi:tRNA pseudouridine38-40 synthase